MRLRDYILIALIAAFLPAVLPVEGANYFVNDSSTNGDVYTAAGGLDIPGRGTNSLTPMRTVTNILASYDLEPGDVVYIDTGIYSNYTISITSPDKGAGGNPVTLRGSTNLLAGGSIIRRNSIAADAIRLETGANHINLEDLTISQSRVGVLIQSQSNAFQRLTLRSNTSGMEIIAGGYNTVARSVFSRNTLGFRNDRVGGSLQSSVCWSNVTAFQFALATPVSNTVIMGGTAFSGTAQPSGDYNIFWKTTIMSSGSGGPYAFLSELQKQTGEFRHSSSIQPNFYNPGNLTNADFHLKSQYGRYNPVSGTFATDTVTSLLIDLGARSASAVNEPQTNRLNIGRYGNTPQASKGRTNAWLLALTYNDGGTLNGTGRVYWANNNFTNGSTVRIEYSKDAGSQWATLASGVPVTSDYYTIVTTGLVSSLEAKWRVVHEADTNIADACDSIFTLRSPGHGFSVYVNDGSTLGDVYTSAVGSPANDGLSSSNPLNSVQTVLDNYDLGGGDEILVDTARFTLPSPVTITFADRGEPGNPMTIRGSTNSSLTGTVFRTGNTGINVFNINDADYVRLEHITAADGRYAVEITDSAYCEFERFLAYKNTSGFEADSASDDISFRGCFTINNTRGLRSISNDGWTWENGVSWSNTIAFDVTGGSNPLSVSNSVVAGGTAFSGSTTPKGDHSLFWKTVVKSGFSDFAEFQKSQGGWWRSSVINPHYKSPATLDFHVLSPSGRFNPATGAFVTTDTNYSPLIDFGSSASTAYTNEPSPNGSRLNASAFGGTSEASKSRTNAWLLALTYNDRGTLSVPGDAVYWNAGEIATGSTVRIELTRDNGQTWKIVQTNILASVGTYTWANTNFFSSTNAKYRVVLESNTNVYDATDATFFFKNGPFVYYVNDSSTNGDVYTTAPGNDSNLGTDVGSPKATIKAILDAYDLEGEDLIYVDTGTFNLTANTVIDSTDAGNSNNHVRIIGSTNRAAGGTVLNRTSGVGGAYAIDISGANYVRVSNIRATGGAGGIRVYNANKVELKEVEAFSNNGIGFDIQNSSDVLLHRCITQLSKTNGVWVRSSSNVRVDRNVIWRNGAAGIRANSGSVGVSNSIVVASGHKARCYQAGTLTNIVGNYNDLYAESNAAVGYIVSQQRNQDTLAAWISRTGSDKRSLSVNPRFAAPLTGDFHLKTVTPMGRYVWGQGYVTNDAVTSLLIDSGNPSASFSSEPSFNGGRVNIGLYGNTDQASKGVTNAWLHAASPRSGGWVAGTAAFHWVAANIDTGITVTVDVSVDGGNTWFELTNGVDAADETVAWNTLSVSNTPAALWRATSDSDTNIFDRTPGFFAVRNGNLSIYIDDASGVGDQYTTGNGSPTNWVATSAKPLNSLATALAAYDLEPNDKVYVDAGVYTNGSNIVVTLLDSGATNARVRIFGTTNLNSGASVLDRGNTSAGAYVFEFDTPTLVSVSNLVLRNANVGMRFARANQINIDNIRTMNNASHGVDLNTSTNMSLSRVLSWKNAGYGIRAAGSDRIRINRSVIWSNTSGGLYANAGSIGLSNSVVLVNGTERYAYDLGGSVDYSANYNNILAKNFAEIAKFGSDRYANMYTWTKEKGQDVQSLTHEPLFPNLTTGDFHPMSAAGRFVPGSSVRTNDLVTSPMIDVGNPADSYARELSPNGRRANIGLYANHSEASLSRTNGWLLALTLNDGGTFRGSNYFYWVAGGTATNDSFSFQLSVDAGQSWTNISTNIPKGVRSYLFDSTPFASVPEAKWRIVSNTDTNTFGISPVLSNVTFIINNEPLTYFVNDSSTNGDVYTKAPGSILNSGVTSNKPLATIQQVFDRYSIRAGEVILVDSGTYILSDDLAIASDLVGVATNPIVIQGANSPLGRATVLDGGSGKRGITVRNTSSIRIKHLTIENTTTGLLFYGTADCGAEWVNVKDGVVGYRVHAATNTMFDHCSASEASKAGLSIFTTNNTSAFWDSGVLWSNLYGVYLNGGKLTFSNSVIGAFGTGRYAHYINSGNVYGDYNDYHLKNSAYVAYRAPTGVIEPSVSLWARSSGNDLHTLSHNPKLTLGSAVDFHPKSQGGRYTTAGTVFDTETSVLLDAGAIEASFSNEPPNNAGRRNIGQYGGSAEASITPTNGWFVAVSFNDGGRTEGTNVPLYWIAGGASIADTVAIRFSTDAGASFLTVATNIPATNGVYYWNSTNYPSTARGMWRVASEQSSVFDDTDISFALRNEPLSFYVNDGSTNGDVFCSAAGSGAFAGVSPSEPALSVRTVFNNYDLEPGDNVFIDTGKFPESGVIEIGTFDTGSATNRILVQGSTNAGAGGSVIQSYGFHLDTVQGYEFRNITVSNASTAFELEEAHFVTVDAVQAVDCVRGFEVKKSHNVDFSRSSAIDCSSWGFYHGGNSTNVTWTHGVLWNNAYGVWEQSNPDGEGDLSVENTLIFASGSGRYAYYFASGNLVSDYNNIFLTNGAYAGSSNASPDQVFQTVSRWVRDFHQDKHSLSHDPRFADSSSGDFHPASVEGRYDPSTGVYTNDLLTSVLIDSGNPASAFTNEPLPNGSRVNIGMFGNTTEASLSPTNEADSFLIAVSLNDGGRTEGVQDICWRAIGSVTGDTVSLEYSADGGVSWTSIVTGVDADLGCYSWGTTQFQSSALGMWRVVSDSDTNLYDATDRTFALRNEPLLFYVNDSVTTNGDVYATALGHATNTGVTASSPMASLINLLTRYDLEEGDTVYVDTGTYTLNQAVTIDQFDDGTPAEPITIQGSTNTASSGTVFNQLSSVSHGFYLNGIDGVNIRNVTVVGGKNGVSLNLADNVLLEWVTANSSENGFYMQQSDGCVMRHCVARSASDAGLSITTSDAIWENGVIWFNAIGVEMGNADLFMSNSVIGVSGAGDYAYVINSSQADLSSDYNCVFLTNGAYAGLYTPGSPDTIYQTLSRWVRDYGEDAHSYGGDPRFTSAPAGDFHLKSKGGRYVPATKSYTNDTVNSPLLDGGRPGSAYSAEPPPNGAWLNVGLYGNSGEASLTTTNEANSGLTAVSLNDGGRVEGTNLIYWWVSGPVTGHNVSIEYSPDFGLNWTTVVASIAATNRQLLWDTTLVESSIFGRWKVGSTTDTNIFDMTEKPFAVRNDPLSFYVNDSISQAGDVYTEALGNSTNHGFSTDQPKLSIQAIIDTYDLEPGDTIYVDTGNYLLSQEILIDEFDGGTPSERVTIQGSTNDVSKTVLVRFGSGYGVHLDEADGIGFRDLVIRSAEAGIWVYKSDDCLAEWVMCDGGEIGIWIDRSSRFTMNHCIAFENSDAGFFADQSYGVTWDHGVMWKNTHGAKQESGTLGFGNSIIVADGSDQFAYLHVSGTMTADYNNIYLENGAQAGAVLGGFAGSGTTRYATVSAWVSELGYDEHSLAVDPQFTDGENADFHISSPAGRYDISSSVFITNSLESPSRLLDAGNPASSYAQEPLFNGGRLNIGLFGNTDQASKTPTNAWIQPITFDTGGFGEDQITLRWTAGGDATGHTVTIDFSGDAGMTWSNLTSGVSASFGEYLWDSTGYSSTPVGLWRISSEDQAGLTETNGAFFGLRNGGLIKYYVNDGASAGDVFTLGLGDDDNLGYTPLAPKESLQAILNAYDLQPGDIVYVDTGEYDVDTDITIDDLDSGSTNNPVIIQGSTNISTTGTVFDRQLGTGSVSAIHLYRVADVELRDLKLKNGGDGLKMTRSRARGVNVKSHNNGANGFLLDQFSVGTFDRCFSYDNGLNGVSTEGALNWNQGVVWNNKNAASIEQGLGTFRHSVLQASGSGSRIYDMGIGGSVTSDYNNLVRTNGAIVAEKEKFTGGNDLYETLIFWSDGTGQDENSLSHKPLFANTVSGDFHPKSVTGRRSGTNIVQDAQHSPLIDTGDPSAVYTNEPAPRGTRINLGGYGNTYEASMSKTNPWVLAISVNDGGFVKGVVRLTWAAGGIATDDTVRLEYSLNNGVEWTIFRTNQLASLGEQTWNVSSQPAVSAAKWRVVLEDYTNTWDAVDDSFSIRNNPITIYINDSDTNCDVFATAPGDPGNSGLDPSSPLDSPVTAFQNFSIREGDTIYIDTGTYMISNDWVIGALSRGSSNFPIMIHGSTNNSAGCGGTVIHRAGTNLTRYGLQVTETRFIEMDHIRFTGASIGVAMSGTEGCQLSWIESYGNSSNGFSFGLNQGLVFEHCASWDNNGYGVSHSQPLAMNHCVIWSNRNGAVSVRAGLTVNNSILHAYQTGTYIYVYGQAGSVSGDYNLLHPDKVSKLANDTFKKIEYETLLDWQTDRSADYHSRLGDPLFVNPTNGDFHLRSTAGRYEPLTDSFTNDTISSWAIDAANFTSPYANEPSPNGFRANLGIYGGTSEASKSPTNKEFLAVSLDDGGSIGEAVTLYWLSRGFTPSDKVKVQFSTDGGLSWSEALATNTSVFSTGVTLDPCIVPSTPIGRWRVVSESDTNIIDVSGTDLFVRCGPFIFYVNDNSTNGDIYALSVGNCGNPGTSPAFPMCSISAVLDQYKLLAGDKILVDTGVYPLTNEVLVTSGDKGTAAGRVRMLGSTNLAAGGTVFQPSSNFSGSAMFNLNVTAYIELSDFVIDGGTNGVRLFQASYCVASNLSITGGNGSGIALSQASHNNFDYILVSGKKSGVGSITSTSNRFYSCVFWSNTADAVAANLGNIEVRHSVVHARAPESFCYTLNTNTTIKADYNDLYIQNGATYVYFNGVEYKGLPQWTKVSGQDTHSLTVNPGFYDAAGGDFHLVSEVGRFDPAVTNHVTGDTNTSFLIDTANPTFPYSREPAPNGSRRNIGLYGNTGEASMSRTNAWVYAITASGGGQLEGTFLLVWGSAAIPATNKVSLDYSYDNGITWTSIANNVAIGDREYAWISDTEETGNEKWPSSRLGRWRIVLNSDTNVEDMTDSRFSLRNRPFFYYLNDSSTNGDIYTTTTGSASNLGIFAFAPLDSMSDVLEQWLVAEGDTILVDAGYYNVGEKILHTVADQGLAGIPVVVQGSTGEVPSVFKNDAGSSDFWKLQGSYITVSDMYLDGGNLVGEANGTVLNNITVTNGTVKISGTGKTINNLMVNGGDLEIGATTNATIRGVHLKNGHIDLQSCLLIDIRNALVYGSDTVAVHVINSQNVGLRNATLKISGASQLIQRGLSSVTMKNSVVIADGTDKFCVLLAAGSLSSDYNNLIARNNAWIGNKNGIVNGNWEKLIYWQRESGLEEHSLSHEPLFASEAGGDFHPKSIEGRYSGGSFVVDAQHSPLIDAGDPDSVYTNELTPRGPRINIGAYGNTSEASKSLTNKWLLAVTINDGGVLKGTNTIWWRSGNLGGGDTLRLDYSPNNGLTWTSFAFGVLSSTNQYSWDTTLVTSSVFALWRVVLDSDTNIFDEVDNIFAVRNDIRKFYVNDGSTNNDVFATDIGSAFADGLTPATPMDSLQRVLDTYDMEGSDTVYIDTGVYTLPTATTFIWSDGGDDDYGDVMVRGSTNFAAGGAVLDRQNTSTGVGLKIFGSRVTFQDLALRNARAAVSLDYSENATLEGLLFVSNRVAVVASNSTTLAVRNGRFWNNWGRGVRVFSGSDFTIENNTFAGRPEYHVYNGSVNGVIQNNIFQFNHSTGSVAAVGGTPFNVFIDYNVYDLQTNAFIFKDGSSYKQLLPWQLAVGHDYRSALTNAGIADATGGDFHLKSRGGRYVDGVGWVTSDTSDAWALDKGNPDSDYADEPETNANRVNMGAYGNTIYASKSNTNVIQYVRTWNNSVKISETNSTWPLIWSAVNIPTNLKVRIQYSGDDGDSWIDLDTAVDVYQEYIIWQPTPSHNSYKAWWRFIGETNGVVYVDTNDNRAALFFGEFAISEIKKASGLRQIKWRGAWDEIYQVQYSENSTTWSNAMDGPGVNQDANFLSDIGGDFFYQDVESTNRERRLYRIVWEYYEAGSF